MSRTCSHLSGKKLLFYATLGTEGADSMVLGGEEKSHVIQKSHQMWPKMRLPAYLLSLQGARWVQRHQALPEHLVCLLHQQGQGLPGAQQVPEDKHKRSGIRFPPSLGESTGLVCKGSGLRNVSGLGQEGHSVGHGGQRQKQLKRKRWLGTQVIQAGRGGCVRSPQSYFVPFSRSNRRGPGVGND